MDLNNINFDEIKEKFLSLEKKTLIKYGSIIGSVIFVLIIYYAILNPIVKKKQYQVQDMNLKKQEIANFENDIISINKDLYCTIFLV